MLVAVQLVGVLTVPLNLTVLPACVAPKFEPAIVTDVPAGPEVGERLLMLGASPAATPEGLNAAMAASQSLCGLRVDVTAIEPAESCV